MVKHECVESVTLVEIDEVVVKVAKKYLPAMAAGFQHPKVNLGKIVLSGMYYTKVVDGDLTLCTCSYWRWI